MTLPRVKQTILDGALGLATEDSTQTQVKVGITEKGPLNTLAFFSDATELQAAYGTGPTVEAACHTLLVAGGPVGIMRVNGSVAGTVSAVTKDPSATGTGTVTV